MDDFWEFKIFDLSKALSHGSEIKGLDNIQKTDSKTDTLLFGSLLNQIMKPSAPGINPEFA